jgi:hypothetical protein
MRVLGFAAAAVLLPATLSAQAVEQRRLISGIELRSMSFDSGLGAQRVSQLAVPIGVVLPISRRLVLDAGTFFAQAERVDDAGVGTTLSGITDVQARALLEIVPDAVVLALAANLPSGDATLTGTELDVAGAIASDLITFPVPSFGSGFSLTGGLALAAPVGPWAIGVAGSYRVSGEFQPLADTSAQYRPGGEVRFRFGLDRVVGQGRFSAGFTYSTFATDEFGGSGAFRSGARYVPQLSLGLPLGNGSLQLYAWDLYRRNGEYTGTTVRAPKQNTLALGTVIAMRRGRTLWRPSLEVRRQWEGVTSLAGSGTLVSLGLRYQAPLGSRLTVQPLLRGDVGSLKVGGRSVSFRGFGVGLTVGTSW